MFAWSRFWLQPMSSYLRLPFDDLVKAEEAVCSISKVIVILRLAPYADWAGDPQVTFPWPAYLPTGSVGKGAVGVLHPPQSSSPHGPICYQSCNSMSSSIRSEYTRSQTRDLNIYISTFERKCTYVDLYSLR